MGLLFNLEVQVKTKDDAAHTVAIEGKGLESDTPTRRSSATRLRATTAA